MNQKKQSTSPQRPSKAVWRSQADKKKMKKKFKKKLQKKNEIADDYTLADTRTPKAPISTYFPRIFWRARAAPPPACHGTTHTPHKPLIIPRTHNRVTLEHARHIPQSTGAPGTTSCYNCSGTSCYNCSGSPRSVSAVWTTASGA